MKAALIGLTQSGKSTLLSAMTGKEPAPPGVNRVEEAVVPVPDERLVWLAGIYRPQRVVQATIDCLDLPGLSFVDEAGRAGGRRMVEQSRAADLLVLVVRAFDNPSVPPYRSSVDPRRDLIELQSELLLTDLAVVITRAENLEKQIAKGAKTRDHDKLELEVLLKVQQALEAERPAAAAISSEEDAAHIRNLGLVTLKPLMIVVNVSESDIGAAAQLGDAADRSIPVIALSAKVEQELSQLDEQSRAELMAEMGIKESAASQFVKSCYQAMGLVSFLTVGEDEVRAWPIKRGTSALDAAGKIHTDIKRGFIRAETMAFAELHELGSEKAMRAAGRMRLEGKTYTVQDGDIINFRFNV